MHSQNVACFSGVENVTEYVLRTTERIGWVSPNVIESVIDVPKNGDLLLGIESNELQDVSFVLRIGGQECMGGRHTLTPGGFLPLRVPLADWQTSEMHIVCEQGNSELTLFYGNRTGPERNALALELSLSQLGPFQLMDPEQIMWYNQCAAPCPT